MRRFFLNLFLLWKVYVVIGNYFGSCLCSACFAGEHVVPTQAPSLKRKAAVSLLALLTESLWWRWSFWGEFFNFLFSKLTFAESLLLIFFDLKNLFCM